MPSEEQLNQYYENAYWFNRGGKEMHVNSRDIIHWSILEKFINISASTKINFLNFGAGHGGISHIFWNAGHSVHNVEPSLIPQFYDERWVNYKKINDVKDHSIDLIYGSHSLEHVQNIDLFILEVKRVLKSDGYVFWEVPNGAHSTNGPPKNKIFIPHTYYFRKEFFNEVFSRSIYNETLDSPKSFDSALDWENRESEDGNVIRFLGQI